jgi:hypothetical protein
MCRHLLCTEAVILSAGQVQGKGAPCRIYGFVKGCSAVRLCGFDFDRCRAKLDGNEDLAKFTHDLEAATLATMEAGAQLHPLYSPLLPANAHCCTALLQPAPWRLLAAAHAKAAANAGAPKPLEG